MGKFTKLKRLIPAGAIACLGLVVTVAVARAVNRFENSKQQLLFSQQIDSVSNTLQRSIDTYANDVLSIADLYAASEYVTANEFQNFVARTIDNHPGIQALEWAPLVTAEERQAFESLIRRQGYDSFRIVERNPSGEMVEALEREKYTPVTYISPFVGNERALGFDLSSDETRRLALENALRSQSIVASARITLVQETEEQSAFLMFFPVFQTDFQNEENHADSLLGYVVGVFRVHDLLNASLRESTYDLVFSIKDLDADRDESYLGTHYVLQNSHSNSLGDEVHPSQYPVLCPQEDSCYRGLIVGDREWILAFAPASSYFYTSISSEAVSFFVLGLLITVGLLSFQLSAQAQLKQAQEISLLKQRFFSMVSHELRTPLSTMMVTAQTLNSNYQGLTETKKIDLVQRIENTAKHMSRLVSDILTISRAEIGKLEFSPRLFDLKLFCKDIISELQTCHNRDNINLEMDGNFDIVYLDENLVRSIVLNLLTNAIKYSPDTSPVTLKLSKTQNDIVFQVCDCGSGIPSKKLERLYEVFERGENVKGIQGTGLGLALVKTCVDLHNGNITCDSQKGVGTTFTVRLPLVE